LLFSQILLYDRHDSQREPVMKRTFGETVLLLLAIVMPTVATAEGNLLAPRQLEIIQTVMSADGRIDQALHSEFWELAPKKLRDDPSTQNKLAKMMDGSLAVGLLYQRETWNSIKASLYAGRVSKTPEYEKVKKQTLTIIPTEAYREGALRSIRNAEGLIKAIPNSKPNSSANGYINQSS
jgi:hypothetical protein